jgi:hypothetical protein
MKQIVPFTKEIELKTNIDEITSISLDKSFRGFENNELSGNFDLYFEYKENDISINTKKYSEIIPFNIDIDTKYDTSLVSIDIDDFYYEIEDKKVILHIDILIEGLSYKEEEVNNIVLKHDDRKIEIDETNNSLDLFNDEQIPIELEVEDMKNERKPIFETFDATKETYVTYHVHIVREDDTLDTICQKYEINKDDLSYYNDITTIKMGDKLIVPTYKK